jgi:hypothetical protein
MPVRDRLVSALIDRFENRGLHLGTSGDLVASFPAKHPDVGDARVWTGGLGPRVAVGDIVAESFIVWPSEPDLPAAENRAVEDVVRFLDALFADRLLCWRSVDGRNPAWRERSDVSSYDPLVLDDRVYQRYLWSGPLPLWQASPAIFARGYIRDSREHTVLWVRLNDTGPRGFKGAERDAAARLVADYELQHPD